MRVFITGGTGLVGRRLVAALAGRRDEPVVLTRRPHEAEQLLGAHIRVVNGDPLKPGAWMETVASCDAVVNLAGENIFARRWKEDFKRLLLESRREATRNVVTALKARTGAEAPTLINASAIGYYGPHGDEELDEQSPPGNDFLAQLCQEWEAATAPAKAAGVRCVLLRIGIVLDRAGGPLAMMMLPFRLFAGGKVASGRQWMSWIHHEDLTGLLLFALDHSDAQGPVNGTAPHPVTNREFARALGRAMHRPSLMPTPGFMLRLGLGEVADVIATGQRVLPRRALQLGYSFRFPTIETALASLLA